MQDYGLVTETTLTMDDFQTLASESQSDQIFKLLAILSPLANEVCDLKCNIGEMLGMRHETSINVYSVFCSTDSITMM